MADLGNLSFSVTVKNEADKQLEKIRKDILGKLDIDITPKINVDISAQVREQLKEKFDVSLQVEKQSLDKLRSQVQSVIDGASPSGGRKFTASDLRATRASVLLEEHEQKLASLREQTRQKTANANLAEERLIAARTRSAIENERLKYTQERLNSLMDESAKKGITLSNVFLKLGGTIALEELARKIVTVTGEFEFMEQAIKSLVGSEKEGIELMGKLRDFAKISPLEVKDVTKAAQTLLGFNVELAKVPDMIQRIGDVSMGNQDRFNALTLAFAQTTSAARLTGEDLRQYVNAGFNPLQVISEKTGKSMRELKDEMSKGAISLQMVEQAFIDATSAGGKFYQMSEKQSQTINGQLAKLSDSLDRAFDSIGRNNKGIITGAISSVATLVDNYEKVIHVIEGLITTYGLYRTAVFLATEAEKGYTIAQTLSMQASILLEKSQKALNATILANPYVLAAVALGGLITVMLASIDTTKEAEIANERYNEAVRKNSEEVDKEKKHIDDLLNTLSDESEAQGKRTAAYNELLEKYPEIFSKYKTEKDLIDNITEARQRENAEIEKKARLLSKQQYDAANNRKKELNRLKWLQDNINLNTHGKKPTPEQAEYIRLYRKYEKEIKQAQTWYGSTNAAIEKLSGVADKEFNINVNERRKQQIADFTNAIKNLTPEQAKAQAKRYNDLIRQANASGKKWIGFGGDYVPISLDDAKNVAKQLEEQANKETHTLKEWAEKTAKNTDEARKAAKGVFDDTRQYTKEQAQKIIKDANAALEASEKDSNTFKISDEEGDTQKKLLEREQRDAEKLTEIRTKQAVEMERAARDLEFSTRSAEIGAMEEGTLKILAQIELDKEKKLEAIKREYEDLRLKRIEEAKKLWDADPNKRGENFYKSEAYKEAASDSMYSEAQINNRIQREREVEAEYIRSIRKVNDEETKAMLEYLKNHGNTEQKRLAIKKEYDEKIAREENEWRRKSLEKEREAALSNLNWEAFKELNNWGEVFGNLDKMPLNTIRKMISAMKEYGKTAKMDVTETKAWYEAIEKLTDKATVLDPINSLTSSIGDLTEALKNEKIAQEKYDIAHMPRAERKRRGIDESEVIQDADQNLTDAQKKTAAAFETLKKACIALASRFQQLGNSLTSLGSSVGGGLGDVLGGFGSMLNNLGSGIAAIKDLNLNEKGFTGVMNKVTVITTVVSSMIELNKAFASILPSTESLYEKHAEEQKKVNQLREAIDAYRVAVAKARAEENGWIGDDPLQNLQEAYEIHGEVASQYFKKLYEAQEAYVESSAGINKAILPILAAAAAVTAVFTAGSSVVAVAGLWSAIASTISSAAIGAVVGGTIAAGVGAVVGQAIQAGIDAITYKEGQIDARRNMKVQTQHRTFFRGEKTQNLEEWVKENMGLDLFEKNGLIDLKVAQAVLDSGVTLVGETKETLEKLMELREQYDEWEKSIKEYISGSFGGLADNMTDAIWDWLANGENALDNFKDYASDTFKKIAQDAVKTFLKTTVLDQFQDQLENLYKAYSMKDNKTGKRVINEEQLMLGVASLAGDMAIALENVMPIAEQLGETIKTAFDYQGYDVVSGGSGKSSSMSREIQSITESTGGLIASYTNAIRGDLSAIRAQQALSLPVITAALDRSNVLAETQVTHLQQIAANTLRNADAADRIYDILHASQTGSRRLEVNLYSRY